MATKLPNRTAPATLVLAAEPEQAEKPAVKLVRARNEPAVQPQEPLSRRRWGAIAMALVAVAALVFRRSSYDDTGFIALELVACLACLALAAVVQRKRVALALRSDTRTNSDSRIGSNFTAGAATAGPLRQHGLVVGLVALVVILPWPIDQLARAMGFGNDFEIVMLCSLAWGGLAAAVVATKARTISLSVVCTGFLTLFATFISDSSLAIGFGYLWGVLCLWWLVSNHWEHVESTAAVDVQPARMQRMLGLLVGCIAFALGSFMVAKRVPVLRKLQAEIMPTSGGTSDRDAAASRGIGNGDALVAAKQHATSFGAIETDFFLDSDQPSLFDMFSEEFGEPRLNKRVERAQALSPQDMRTEEGEFSEANRSSTGGEFDTERSSPKLSKPTEDLASDAVMFWQGQAGAHLAVERYAHFDGRVWTTGTDGQDMEGRDSTKPAGQHAFVKLRKPSEPQSIEIEKRVWMAPSGTSVQNSISPFVAALPEAIKFTKYRSQIIPARAGMQLWSVDQLTRSDFFQYSSDCNLVMPGREHVPDYTVVRMINSRIDLERTDDLLRHCAPGEPHEAPSPDCAVRCGQLAHAYAGNSERGWAQVREVLAHLKRNFKHAPVVDATNPLAGHASSLEAFLESKRGPSYLFATAAALMLEHLGYETRLVVGFYADPKHLLLREREIAIQASDLHAWLEINTGHGYWIPLEPTPGYRSPAFTASWWYRIREAWTTIAAVVAGGLVGLAVVFVFRRLLLELIAWLLWPLVGVLNDRRRIAWLAWLLDTRLRLAGRPRHGAAVARLHINSLAAVPMDLQGRLETVLAAADRLCFGGGADLSGDERQCVREVWRQLTVGVLRRGLRASEIGTVEIGTVQ